MLSRFNQSFRFKALMIVYGFLLFNRLVLNQFCSVLCISYVTIREMSLLTLVQATMFLHSFLRVVFLFNFFLLGKISKLFFHLKNFFFGKKWWVYSLKSDMCRPCKDPLEFFLQTFPRRIAHFLKFNDNFCSRVRGFIPQGVAFYWRKFWSMTRGGFCAAS